MSKILLLKGLPGSGKTTWALEHLRDHKDYKRINKDSLRNMIDGGKWSGKNEKFVLDIRDMIIHKALMDGFNVIVDDTNLHPKHLQRMQDIAHSMNGTGGDVKVEEKFFDVPLMECIYRDAGRPNPIGRRKIFYMWEQFLKPQPPHPDHNKPDAIIVDMDGTLAQKTDRKWTEYDRVSTDEPHWDIAYLTALLAEGHRAIVVSGRPESARHDSTEWMKEHFIPFHKLYMRADGDFRPDSIVKEEIYHESIEPNYNVLYVLDDRDQVVAMWRSLGLRVLQVAYGAF